MFEKRDRWVRVLKHRADGDFLSFPHVCYMAGVSSAAGDAVRLTADAPVSTLAEEIVRLLNASKGADIDAMAKRRSERLRPHRNTAAAGTREREPLGPESVRLHALYPALARGPAALLRQFVVCTIVESERQKQRRITLEARSRHRGILTDGPCVRVPLAAKPAELGRKIIEMLALERS